MQHGNNNKYAMKGKQSSAFGWGNWVKSSGSGGRWKWNGRAVAAPSTGGACPGKAEPALKDGREQPRQMVSSSPPTWDLDSESGSSAN